jgi:hypothetical protein
MRARDNPFAVHRLHALRYRLGNGGWDVLLGRLRELAGRAAIVGPEGSGKTLLLEELAGRLAATGLAPRILTLTKGERRLRRDERGLVAGAGPGEILLVDGADELSFLAWSSLVRASRAAAGLVVTTHRPGLLPTLWTCSTSAELLADLVRELLGEEAAAALAPRLAVLFTEHAGNLRAALRALYDLYGDLPLTAESPREA